MLLFILLVCCSVVNAQWGIRQFRNISVGKGLSQSSVLAIKQDTLGFIWMGTQDGLNRYDSKGFKVYRPVAGDHKSLQSYFIRSLFVDHLGDLWVGGNLGVSRYEYDKDTFVNYKLPQSIGEWHISAITEDAEHNIWAASIVGDIYKLIPGARNFVRVNFNVGLKKISYLGSWKNEVLIGADAGFFQTSHGEKKLLKINLGVDEPNVSDVHLDGPVFWIATEGNGLLRYNFETREIKNFTHSSTGNSVADNNIKCLAKDDEGNLWLGTFRGLSILNPATSNFENYYHHISQPFTISQNSVRSIYRDKQNGMWLGTYYGGANYYHKNDIKFNLLSQNTGKLSLNDEVVSVIKQDKAGNFWIGTNDNGLNYWDRRKNTITYYTSSEFNANTIASNNVKAIEFDNNGNVFIGAHAGGFNVLNLSTGNIKRYLHDKRNPGSIAGDLVYSILSDHKGRIWVGTRSGLDLFQPQSGQFKHIREDSVGKRLNSYDITYLFEDSKRRIWIGTSSGVSLLYPDKFRFVTIDNSRLFDDMINCIVEDHKKRIWVGTKQGLALYDESKHSFTTFAYHQYFLKGTIYGILPDDDNNLWISTNSGLVKFNPDTGFAQTFDETDGLQNNQFNVYSFCRANDGMFLFGGIKGISYFYPSMIKQQPLSLGLSFTRLEVFNKAVVSGDDTGILKNHIDQSASLEFNSEQKQFSLFFNTFNYISPNRTGYYYKLKGFDNRWEYTEGLKVTYNNLAAGTYIFLIKAVGPNKETSALRSIKIVVFPPWYNAMWFYLLVFLFACIAAYIVYRIVSERIKAIQQLKLERIEKEKVRDINQVKMDFFTNVSHELRTPLTLILAPLEELIKRPSLDRDFKRKFELMFTNAKRLYNLVEQLFEFKKTEMGTRQLKVTNRDLVSFIHEIYISFKPLSKKNGIRFSFHSAEPKLLFCFDKDAMEKVLFNLLSNAFKYTSEGQNIDIELSTADGFAIIEICDTGIGINEQELLRIFDRFYQASNNEINLGSGVGLAFTKSLVELHHGTITAKSQLGSGSTFSVIIPMSESFYKDDRHNEKSVYELPEVQEVNAVSNELMGGDDLPVGDVPDDKQAKILVVDDNQEILNFLQEYFNADYSVSVALDGKEALKMLENQQYDLIISDVMMPELDGLHFCKRVKQNINTSHIPFVLLTARGETDQQIKGIEMGADDYVTKPFSTTLLGAKVNNLLRSRKRLKEHYLTIREIVPENIAFNIVDEEFLKKAIAIIELHLSNSEFSVDQFSLEIGMSKSKLYHKLKAITGESGIDFIKRIRFKNAVELIETNQYTIAQIAYMCGFNTPSYFSTAFKQFYGCMPTEYVAKKDI